MDYVVCGWLGRLLGLDFMGNEKTGILKQVFKLVYHGGWSVSTVDVSRENMVFRIENLGFHRTMHVGNMGGVWVNLNICTRISFPLYLHECV